MTGETERIKGSPGVDRRDGVSGCSEPLSVLVSAYACGPNWGSEIGMGWNWIVHLSRYCRLTIITEGEFRTDIETAINRCSDTNAPCFHFLEVGGQARKRFWNQGDWRFYADYREWQQRAYRLASQLVKEQHFDVVHQLNMIGYREPGYLWRLARPFVWGPVGGHAQMPWRFLPVLGIRGAAFYTCRNILNWTQMRVSHRVRQAVSRADSIVTATLADQDAVLRVHNRHSTLIGETGAHPNATPAGGDGRDGIRPFRVVWCGKFIGLKALPIALHALATASKRMPFELRVVGAGQEQISYAGRGGPGADVDTACQMARLGRLANLGQVVHYVRIHDQSIQSSFDSTERLQRTRFALSRALAALAGREPPTWDMFLEEWNKRTIAQRLSDRREMLLGRVARKAQWCALNGAMIPRGCLFMAGAFLLAPKRMLGRLGHRLFAKDCSH